MVNDAAIEGASNLELASLGEVLYAFSALRSTSVRRQRGRAEGELLPWRDTAPHVEAAYLPPITVREPIAMVPAVASLAPKVVKPKRTSARCQCGQCKNCLDNARWERIFQEKFASKDYYRPDIHIRYASPLSGM